MFESNLDSHAGDEICKDVIVYQPEVEDISSAEEVDRYFLNF